MWDCRYCQKSSYDDLTRCSHCGKPRYEKADLEYGPINPKMVCPHCQTAGGVRARSVKMKAGVSGGKATAALLTGGLSLLAVGLSRKETHTQAHCENCGSTWIF